MTMPNNNTTSSRLLGARKPIRILLLAILLLSSPPVFAQGILDTLKPGSSDNEDTPKKKTLLEVDFQNAPTFIQSNYVRIHHALLACACGEL